MDVKMSLEKRISLVLPNPITTTTTNPISIRCCLKSWINSKESFKKNFIGLAENCKFHFLEMSKTKGQSSNNHCFIHVVKEGETLNSISRQYGVSIHSIVAANKSVPDVDLLFKGQLLNIPDSAPAETQLCQIKKSRFHSLYQQERFQGSLNILDGSLYKKPFMPTAQGLLHVCALNYQAKSTGYFLVLVPLIAFCVRCIIGAFRTGFCRDTQHQTLNEPTRHHDRPRNMRWKSALSDNEEPILDSESRADSTSTSEDQDQMFFEDTSHAYSKLEHDYQKFLSECGMSTWGYWRGGLHR